MRVRRPVNSAPKWIIARLASRSKARLPSRRDRGSRRAGSTRLACSKRMAMCHQSRPAWPPAVSVALQRNAGLRHLPWVFLNLCCCHHPEAEINPWKRWRIRNSNLLDPITDGVGRSSNDFSGLSDAACPAPTEIEEDPHRVKQSRIRYNATPNHQCRQLMPHAPESPGEGHRPVSRFEPVGSNRRPSRHVWTRGHLSSPSGRNAWSIGIVLLSFSTSHSSFDSAGAFASNRYMLWITRPSSRITLVP
jgi:hypothetical protein